MTAVWHAIQQGLAASGFFLAWTACVLLCLSGLLLSALSISGTWLVGIAALIAAALSGPNQFPGGPTLVVFFAVCVAVDIIEWFAASWGVRRRGGSTAAGWLALLGSLGGLILGSLLIPLPLIGGLIGMLVGSFSLVYWVEKRRLQKSDHAAHIATGAVLAGLAMLLLKVIATTGLILALAVGLLF